MSKPVSLQLDDALLRELEELAQAEQRDITQLASDALREWVALRRKRARAIEEALHEAKRGEFISREAIHRWIASWDTENELPPPQPDITRR